MSPMLMSRYQSLLRIAREVLRCATKCSVVTPTWKRFVAAGLSSSLAVSLFTTSASQSSVDDSKPKNFDLIVREADLLYDSYLIENAYNILKRWGSSDCSELLWRLARVLCEKAKLRRNTSTRVKDNDITSKDKTTKESLMYEAFAVVKKALEKEPKDGCFGAHKWYAILLDYIGEIEGNKSRIQKAYEVREHLERALQIYSSDATTWHILGVWHFSFADMGYATRLVAKAIFGTPPTSTYDRALHYFLKAEEMSPGFYSTNTYYIGETYEKMGNKEEAIKYYMAAFKMPIVTVDDNSIHEKAYEKLRRAGLKDSQMI